MDAVTRKMPFIDLGEQYRLLKQAIDARMQAVLDHGQYIMGPEVAELERRLAAFVGVRHCVGVSDGTTALLIALMALGIGPEDEVITTPFTFIATGGMITLLGAKPVFVDIDPVTFNIDGSAIEAAITPRTRAIMPVSLYGQCADMDEINRVAGAHGLSVIEDGAQSFGGTYKGKYSCGLSTIGCTSFFPSKPLGCYGDGGACFTDDDDLAVRMSQIRVHGQSARYRHTILGLNGRLDTLQAAVLLAKLDNFPLEIEQRAAAAELYSALIREAGIDGVTLPMPMPHSTSVHGQFTIRVRNRAAVAARMAEDQIPTAVHYPMPLHQQPLYSPKYGHLSFPHAEAAAREVLSLPMYPTIPESVQRRVVKSLADAMQT